MVQEEGKVTLKEDSEETVQYIIENPVTFRLEKLMTLENCQF